MGFVSDLFGATNNYAPGEGNIINPVGLNDAQTADARSVGALAQQQQFLNALQGQNGIGNQSSVFGQQQGLANQLQSQALGNGPNPALAQLAQTTGQNAMQQGSLMAGQRGASANAGLLARQAAMQGAGVQQNAVGQAAVLRANQQLAAQQALQQQQGLMGNMATQQVGQQQNATLGMNQLSQNHQQMLLNSIAQQNNANVGYQNNSNNIAAGAASQNAGTNAGIAGGIMNSLSLGSMSMGGGKAYGGEIQPQYLFPGGQAGIPAMVPGDDMSMNLDIQQQPIIQSPAPAQEPQKVAPVAAQSPNQVSTNSSQVPSTAYGAGYQMGKGIGQIFSPLGGGGSSGGSSSGGGGIMSMLPMLMALLNKGGTVGGQLKEGGSVPGKAKVRGDSVVNDTVSAKLSPGEVVIPRTVMQSADPVGNAAKFVAAILARKGN